MTVVYAVRSGPLQPRLRLLNGALQPELPAWRLSTDDVGADDNDEVVGWAEGASMQSDIDTEGRPCTSRADVSAGFSCAGARSGQMSSRPVLLERPLFASNSATHGGSIATRSPASIDSHPTTPRPL